MYGLKTGLSTRQKKSQIVKLWLLTKNVLIPKKQPFRIFDYFTMMMSVAFQSVFWNNGERALLCWKSLDYFS